MNIDLMRRFLTSKGYLVDTAMDGETALNKIAESPPDVILLDLIMPGMHGLEVCERLKGAPSTRHIPIIIITGISEHETNVKALELGADDFLVRPFDSLLLNARIHSSVRSKFLQDQILTYQHQLEERVRERTAEIERTQQVTIFSLAKLAESRDPETGQHLDRIRRYVRILAAALSTKAKFSSLIDEQYVERLYLSSPLHDIGKVGIPDQILLKPGKLSTHEFEIMKTHTIIGGDTLKAADEEAGAGSFLAMGKKIAYSHHERWDGTGYPYGLSGEAIPLTGRITAVADVYDALSSRRPYKEPFSHEKSKAIILEGKGSHFDADVIDAFLECEQHFCSIRESFSGEEGPSMIQRLVESLEQLHTGPEPEA
ncbi:MAG: response regulator [Candidatus Hydrogenedentes bacterium]|nr:response regulator [Candidatus Hydrogenedentota bacterium]